MVKAIGKAKSHQDFLALLYRLIDIGTIFFSLSLALYLYNVAHNKDYFVISLIGLISYFLAAESLSLYRSWRSGYFKQVAFYTFSAWAISIISVLIFLFFSKSSVEYSRAVMAIWFIVTIGFLVGWRLIFKIFLLYIRTKGHNTRAVGIIGLNETSKALIQEIYAHPETGYRLKGVYFVKPKINLDDGLITFENEYQDDIEEAIALARNDELEVIFIALPLVQEEIIKDLLLKFSDTNALVHIVPDMFVHSLINTPVLHIGNIQTVSVYDDPMQGHQAAIKRVEDIILSLSILCVIALPMLIIAIKLKLNSDASILFKQNRYGLNGKKISVWKFRTMTVSECDDDVVQATKSDERVTPFGAFLRRTSLDELPQFINVLKGDMSVVGPRPHAISHNEAYRKQVDYYMLRHKVKPGITGWAQINGWRGETDSLKKMEMRVNYDLAYIRNWSLLMDIKIVFLTVIRGFTDKNAY